MITGTREGMTIDQWATFGILVSEFWSFQTGPFEWHDGDCVGADSQAHQTIAKLKLMGLPVELHGHPCNLDSFRAWNEYDVTHEIRPPLVRNRVMVDASDLVIATPKEFEDVPRGSGTWATIRYARLKGRPLVVVWPDASVARERIP